MLNKYLLFWYNKLRKNRINQDEIMENNMKKRYQHCRAVRVKCLFLACILLIGLTGCGKKEKNLEGTCAEILDKVYENADLDADFREAMQYFETTAIDAESAEYLIGTTEVSYSDSVFSAPMMNAVAYQCILLRVAEGQDIEQAKATIEEHADPAKWICVEAEKTIVENVGDVILFIMADEPTATAVADAFMALGE